ncbi:hypothetical protein JCM3775_002599 [Rhodotorula graminis]
MWEALLDPKAWCLTIAMFGSSVPNGILTNFSGTIIKDMGFSTFDAALLDCAGRSFQIISLIIAGLVANYVKNPRMLMVTVGDGLGAGIRTAYLETMYMHSSSTL